MIERGGFCPFRGGKLRDEPRFGGLGSVAPREAIGTQMAATTRNSDGDGFLPPEVKLQWSRIRTWLREEYGDTVYNNWFKPMTLLRVDAGCAWIGVPTPYTRDWSQQNYQSRLRARWNEENRKVTAIEFIVANGAAAEAEPVEPVPGPRDILDGGMSAPLDPRFTFENFVVGKPNEFAHAAAKRVAEATIAESLQPPFNPLFLHGGVGLGKTHLMHAIAWEMRRNRPGRRFIYLSAEKFMYQFVRALRSKDTMPFKEIFRSVDVLLIDDFQFIGGKESTQEEFFHTFNALVDMNRQIVISADKSPSDLDIEERMRSRLVHGMVADVHPTTYELRLVILQSKAEQLRLAIPPKVLEFLAHKITSNVRELEGALNRITAHAQFTGRDITVDSAEEVLHDLLRKNDRRVTIDEIQKRVAEHYNIRSADMHSARRAREIARPRQVAMYLCKMLTPRSLPEIGKKFGGRDHTTVIHAIRRIEELSVGDRTLAEDISILTRLLQTGEKSA
jgi:chromosomal replication initiator protein